jgi:Fe-S cluster assembly iron-binding protein IscA
MINKTNLLRTAALSLALLASSCRVYAAADTNPFETIINVIRTIKITESDVATLKDLLKETHNAALMLDLKAMGCSDITACLKIKEDAQTLRTALAELSTKFSFLKIQRGADEPLCTLFEYATYYLNSADSYATRSIAWQTHIQDICAFAKDLISSATYSDAWQVVVAPDTLLGKAEILWNHHKPAVVGAAIVATAVTACVLGRNKIKAGWNRLFGSAQPSHEASASEQKAEENQN